MKYLKIIFVLLIVVSFISCGKKTETITKTTENKEQKQTTTPVNSDNSIATVKSVESSAEKNVLPAFTWTEKGVDKTSKDLKGKVVFVNFWATWCAPCKKEMPDLSKLNDELKGKDFQMIGLCVFEGNEIPKITEVLKNIPVTYLNIQGNENLVNAFKSASGNNLEAVPTSFIIDKSGKIVKTYVGMRDKKSYEDGIKEFLN